MVCLNILQGLDMPFRGVCLIILPGRGQVLKVNCLLGGLRLKPRLASLDG